MDGVTGEKASFGLVQLGEQGFENSTSDHQSHTVQQALNCAPTCFEGDLKTINY